MAVAADLHRLPPPPPAASGAALRLKKRQTYRSVPVYFITLAPRAQGSAEAERLHEPAPELNQLEAEGHSAAGGFGY